VKRRSVENAVGTAMPPYRLTLRGYRAVATVEQKAVNRLATVRMIAPAGAKVDLLFATSGLEPELVGRAESLHTAV
jgi:hypothetical protein